MRKLTLVALIICMTFAFTACQDGIQTRDWNVSGMACVACERTVSTILDELGVTVTSISASNNNVQFEFDPSEISEDEIIRALAAGGYRVE